MTLAELLQRGEDLSASGAHEQAEACFVRVVGEDPALVAAWCGLGQARLRQGKLDAAIAAYRQAVAIAPGNVTAQLALGTAWMSTDQLILAARHFRAAIQADPNHVESYRRLGEALSRSGDWRQAGAAYYECLKRDPRDSAAALGVAQAFGNTGQLDMALRTLRRAAELTPDKAEIHAALGQLLLDLQRASEAADAFKLAVGAAPGHLPARRGLVAAMRMAGDLDKAVALCRALAAEFPQDGQVHADLGRALLSQGSYVEAESSLREAAMLRPFDDQIAAMLVDALEAQSKLEDAAAVRELAEALKPVPNEALRQQLTSLLYEPSLTPEELRKRTEELVAPFDRRTGRRPAISLEPERKLRIGWLSSDFRYHVVAANLRPVVDNLDRTAFDQYFYRDKSANDPLSRHFQSLATAWRAVEGLSDAELAAIVRRDEIDILVILAGRFDQNRPVIAGRRAAPIQISFHDPATSGLSSMDYIVSDRVLTPAGAEKAFTERVLRLPSFYIREAPDGDPAPGPLPMLQTGAITLGSFNNPLKITAPTLRLWARVLRAVPNARLLLSYYDRYASTDEQTRIVDHLRACGVVPDQLMFQGAAAATGGHLARYHDIDIALDPLPFSGSTTSFEALWMGVPVVTWPGATMVSRWTASMLHALRLDEFIAETQDDYVAIVSRWAGRAQELASLRQQLRARLTSSSLCNGKLRGRQMARLFRAVWRRHCQKAARARV